MAATKFTFECDASYEIVERGEMIRVTALGKSKTTQLGSTPPLTLAKMLAREIVQERTRG